MSSSLRPGRPLKLLMTADAVGGVWTYALDLAQGLASRDVRVTLAVLGPKPASDQLDAARAVPGLEVVLTGAQLDWTAAHPGELRAAATAVSNLAQARQVDLVHLNSPALAGAAHFGGPVVGACHSCLASWWSAVRGGEMPEDFRWRTEALERGYRACDALVAPSVAFSCVTASHYDVAAPRVVRNGRREPAVRAAAPRDRLALTAGRLWDEGKNVAALDAAAARLASPLFAAGPLEGPSGQTMTLRHAQALGRLDSGALALWFGRASVFASLALYEPFGLAVLEAAQAGCALVLSDIPSFRELWGGAAEFVRADDPAVAAAAIQALLDHPERAARAGEAARRRSRVYTVQAMAEGVLGVYREALDVFAEREAAA